MYSYENKKIPDVRPAVEKRAYTPNSFVNPHLGSAIVLRFAPEAARSDPADLERSIIQRIAEDRPAPHISTASAVVQLESPVYLPPLANDTLQSRHHIIPKGTMTGFINALIEISFKDSRAAEMLQRILSNAAEQYTSTWKEDETRTYSKEQGVSRKNIRRRYDEDVPQVTKIIKKIKPGVKLNDNIKSIIKEMFLWLPSNLVIGPKAASEKVPGGRTNDPKNNLDLEAFRIRTKILRTRCTPSIQDENAMRALYKAMENFGSTPTPRDLETVSENFDLLTSFNKSILEASSNYWNGPNLTPLPSYVKS